MWINLTDTENVDIISSRNNPAILSEKNINIYTPSQQRERRQWRLQRQELRRQTLGGIVGRYERGESSNGDDLSVCGADIDDELDVGQQGCPELFQRENLCSMAISQSTLDLDFGGPQSMLWLAVSFHQSIMLCARKFDFLPLEAVKENKEKKTHQNIYSQNIT